MKSGSEYFFLGHDGTEYGVWVTDLTPEGTRRLDTGTPWEGRAMQDDTTFGLGGIGADDFDVQLSQGASELGHAGHVFIGFWNTENSVFVAVERDGTTMFEQIAFQSLEVAERALGGHKPELHQRAGGVIDEDEQGAGITPILEPPVV